MSSWAYMSKLESDVKRLENIITKINCVSNLDENIVCSICGHNESGTCPNTGIVCGDTSNYYNWIEKEPLR